mmetsp:Transcript_45855/g.132292  ORF Transcript_45855/g.132292 Transcript_45855/m.132292 type:complete len:287 (+) Transcript_45855:713-1573(+)
MPVMIILVARGLVDNGADPLRHRVAGVGHGLVSELPQAKSPLGPAGGGVEDAIAGVDHEARQLHEGGKRRVLRRPLAGGGVLVLRSMRVRQRQPLPFRGQRSAVETPHEPPQLLVLVEEAQRLPGLQRLFPDGLQKKLGARLEGRRDRRRCRRPALATLRHRRRCVAADRTPRRRRRSWRLGKPPVAQGPRGQPWRRLVAPNGRVRGRAVLRAWRSRCDDHLYPGTLTVPPSKVASPAGTPRGVRRSALRGAGRRKRGAHPGDDDLYLRLRCRLGLEPRGAPAKQW